MNNNEQRSIHNINDGEKVVGKVLTVLMAALLSACTNKDSANEVPVLPNKLTATADIHISNYAPSSLKDVTVKLELPKNIAGYQSISLLRGKGEIRFGRLYLDIGNMAPRETQHQGVEFTLAYSQSPLSLEPFSPMETFTALEAPAPTVTDNQAHQHYELADQLEKADRQLLKDIQALQQQGESVYVFEGVICHPHKPCKISEKQFWYELARQHHEPKPTTEEIKFIYHNLTALEEVKFHMLQKNRFAESSAVVALK